ncbi:MAG: hypothetical protein JWN04_3204 [Myxococcaceae bacterium]|nr:hypothetical protein [Myxococcaceae bacterium]
MLAPAGAQDVYVLPDGILQTRSHFPGGSLIVRGQPSLHPTRVLLTVRPSRRLDASPCQIKLYRDGAPVAVQESRRANDYEVLIALEVVALRKLHDSVRFAGEACGRSFELDAPSRATLSAFEARFVEERSKLESVADSR